MKKTTSCLIFLFIGIISANAQSENAEEKKEIQEMNLLDEQSKLFGNIFGDMEEDIDGTKDPFKDVENYEDLLNKSNLDLETKAKFWAMYELYDKSLQAEEKDSIKIELEKFLNNNLAPSTDSTQQNKPY